MSDLAEEQLEKRRAYRRDRERKRAASRTPEERAKRNERERERTANMTPEQRLRRKQLRARYYAENAAKEQEQHRAWLVANPGRAKALYRDRNLSHKFGLTSADYDRMLFEHGEVCAICKRPETVKRLGTLRALNVDHCHKTGRIRGLLCSGCNTGIGNLGDSPERLRAAAAYIERASKEVQPIVALPSDSTGGPRPIVSAGWLDPERPY